jgi:hypothetical protein|tara:strand:- start:472 stop:663 length:192 start_codon:yes stop_codon:yes gene_type:complete
MPTHAKIAGDLLREAANFFKSVAEQNPAIAPQMTENAEIYMQAADLIENDPTGEIADQPVQEQ